MFAKRVLSVGQCFADHGSISHTLRKHFGAEVVAAATASEALDEVRQQKFHLVLVNRVLDADGSRGVDVIAALKADANLSAVPVMLVSNYDDAQSEATAKGALPGFGKGSLGHPAMLERVKAVLG